MTADLISKLMLEESYKAHTKDSYHKAKYDDIYRQFPSNCKERQRALDERRAEEIKKTGITGLLPNSISFIADDKAPAISRDGRGQKPRVKQMKGYFTDTEKSPYMQNKPNRLHTSLWGIDGYPTYFYGIIGITGADGKISRDGTDLVIVHTTDWISVDVYIFKGMANSPAQLKECLEYLTSH